MPGEGRAERGRGLRVLVCGGRHFDDAELLGSWLGGIHEQSGISCIIEGEASGADTLAKRFAEWKGIPINGFRARWHEHGKAAGPIRNGRMLADGKPDLVVAFAGGKGTADLVRQARRAGIPALDTASPQSVATYRRAQASPAPPSPEPIEPRDG